MNESSFTHSVENRYFEDYVAGSVHKFGSIPVEKDEVIAFGKRFVPLAYHTDPDLAKQSIYGGLIASGWHTAGLMIRLYTDNYLSKVANLGSPGVDDLCWEKPVYPGDELSIRVTVLETRISQSRPDRGIVRSFIEVLNQNREVVMSLKTVNFVRSRSTLEKNSPSFRSAAVESVSQCHPEAFSRRIWFCERLKIRDASLRSA
jgi:acyl dehydratase